MSERRGRGFRAAGWLAVFALAGMTLAVGCGRTKPDEAAAGPPDREAPTGARAAERPGPGAGGARRGPGARGRGPGMAGVAAQDVAAAPGEGEQTAEEPAEGEDAAEGEEPAKTGIPEVDKAKKLNDFAALYGPTKVVNEENWDDSKLSWLVFTCDLTDSKVRGAAIKLPISMAMYTDDLSILAGYFPIYVASRYRASGKLIPPTETITAPRITIEEYQQARAEAKAAAAPEEGAEPAEGEAAPAPAAPAGPGARRGGPRGGMGGRRGF